jgi:hypothetical protein
VILSLEDLGGDRGLLARYIRQSRLLVQTVGAEGAIVYHNGCETRTSAYEVNEQDPTGAGDVFAAAFLLRLFETDDAVEAARYANSAASFVVEGVGIANVPTREQVEWRLRYGRLRDKIRSRGCMGRVYALANQKGGVGKTTTQSNLWGRNLAYMGQENAPRGCGPAGQRHQQSGVNKTALSRSIYDVLIGAESPLSLITLTGRIGLDLLPSSPALAGAEVELVDLLGARCVCGGRWRKSANDTILR